MDIPNPRYIILPIISSGSEILVPELCIRLIYFGPVKTMALERGRCCDPYPLYQMSILFTNEGKKEILKVESNLTIKYLVPPGSGWLRTHREGAGSFLISLV